MALDDRAVVDDPIAVDDAENAVAARLERLEVEARRSWSPPAPQLISSLRTTSTPLPRDCGSAATRNPSSRLAAPSYPSVLGLRIDPTTTTGFSLRTVRFRK